MNQTMRQLAKGVLVSAPLLLTVLLVYGPTAAPVHGDPTKDVVVTNTGVNPVPVTGTVQASQSGPWSVNISGTPTVITPTHLGVQSAALVTLEYRNISTEFSGCSGDDTICSAPRRILPNGDRASLAVPSGFVLVLTDIQWTAAGDDEGASAIVYSPTLGYTSYARFDGLGQAQFNEHFTSGIVVSSVPTLVFGHHLSAHLGYLIVRGYLAPA
jgi:hypothetical protein